jgi:hypothetical protein
MSNRATIEQQIRKTLDTDKHDISLSKKLLVVSL